MTVSQDQMTRSGPFFLRNPDRSDGIEGFGRIAPNWYFGGEIGIAANVTILSGEEISFIPIELNLKYAKEVARNLVIDFGAGVAACYAELVYENMFPAMKNQGMTGFSAVRSLQWGLPP